MSQIGFVILYTRDVAKKTAFYERAFGMQKKYLAGKEVFGEMHGDVPLQFVQEDFARGRGLRAEPCGAVARGHRARLPLRGRPRGLPARHRGRVHVSLPA
jgi:catechol 2,3-dioxygenase-like lactoylglutathione lyase family enzyme